MFEILAHVTYRRRWFVLAAWLLTLSVAAGLASQVGSVLGPGDFAIKNSESARAATVLNDRFHLDSSKVTLVVMVSPKGPITAPVFRRTVARTASRIQADQAARVVFVDNPLVSGNQQLIGRDGRSIAVQVSSDLTEPALEDQIDHLRSLVQTPGFTTYVTGTAAINHDGTVTSQQDLTRGDAITLPILLLILLLVFGTVVGAGLPLLLALCSITLSIAAVFLIGHVLPTSVYVTEVITFLGLGIGIDYSLFLLSRFREELEVSEGDVEASVVRTMQTVGRTVFFSGLTVTIGLSSLLLTRVTFMESIGLGGMLVPLTSVIACLTLLPALLSVLGPRVNRFRLLPHRFSRRAQTGVWHGLALGIMRRPFLCGGGALVVLLALALPVTRLTLAFESLKNQPQSLQSVQGIEYMQQHFATQPDPIQVVIQYRRNGSLLQPGGLTALRRLENRMRSDTETSHIIGPADFASADGVVSATAGRQLLGRLMTTDGRYAIISVVPKHDIGTAQAGELVNRIHQLARTFEAGELSGSSISVGGTQAQYTDFNTTLYRVFPFIVGLVLLLTYGFLFFAFRSVLLPLKAVLLNLLSVGASFGMMELVFQQGVGSSLLGFAPESGVASWIPVFLFAFLFGLSMDYEVFLLSRVREHWLATRMNTESVAIGLEQTGGLITSAAFIMVVAFSGFLLGSNLEVKEFGFGMVAAVVVDATLIRIVLVPSAMRVMGSANWWVPVVLRRR